MDTRDDGESASIEGVEVIVADTLDHGCRRRRPDLSTAILGL